MTLDKKTRKTLLALTRTFSHVDVRYITHTPHTRSSPQTKAHSRTTHTHTESLTNCALAESFGTVQPDPRGRESGNSKRVMSFYYPMNRSERAEAGRGRCRPPCSATNTFPSGREGPGPPGGLRARGKIEQENAVWFLFCARKRHTKQNCGRMVFL